MSAHVQRILMSCKDWSYIQYFASLLSKCCPNAIFRIVENPKDAIRTAKDESFDVIILDAEQTSPDIGTPIEEIASLASHPKVFVFAETQMTSAKIITHGCETIRRPYRHKEMLKLIGQRM